jgi:Putative transposase
VLGVYARALLASYARTAQAHRIRDGQTGTVTVIQRFASGLQLNIHFHTFVLDGVFHEARPGHLILHPAPARRDEDLAQILATVRTRVGSCWPGTGSSQKTTPRRLTRSRRRPLFWLAS